MKHIKTILVVAIILATTLFCGFKIHNDRAQFKEWQETCVVKTVVVQSGEGIDHFGYKYKPSWMDVREYRYLIQELNNLDGTMLHDGQRLKVYVEASHYTAQGICLDDGRILTTDGHGWEYDTDIIGCVNITFSDYGTTDNITDDVIISIEHIQ